MSVLTLDSLVDIGENHVSYHGNKYFRRNADRVELGSHGRKKDSVLSVNYMSISAKIARRHLETVPINVGDPIGVNWSETSQDSLSHWGGLKFFGMNSEIATSFDHRTAETQRLKLMCIWINEDPLKKCLNYDANTVRENMAEEGKDARIVSSLLIVADTHLAEHFATHSSDALTMKAKDADLAITAGTGRVGSKTIRLAAGTCFAYGLHKPKKWTKGKDQIERLEDDWFSFG
ncbi:MAG: hypothetical protein R8G34_18895 [Paracoccaceae bacterium]|nr:hypothetical protein [Paracoccaceae bacterium]